MTEHVILTYQQAADLVPELAKYHGLPAVLPEDEDLMTERAVIVYRLWEKVGHELGGYRLIGVVTDGYRLIYEKES